MKIPFWLKGISVITDPISFFKIGTGDEKNYPALTFAENGSLKVRENIHICAAEATQLERSLIYFLQFLLS